MIKVWWRWYGNCKYEFYFEGGKRLEKGDGDYVYVVPPNITHMININIIGTKVSNKRGDRVKKLLLSPPQNRVVWINETWCFLSAMEKSLRFIILSDLEFSKLVERYRIKVHSGFYSLSYDKD